MPKRIGVVAAEPVIPLVAASAELSLTRLSFHFVLVRTNAQIAATDWQLRACLHGFDFSAAVTVGDVEPIVDSPTESVGAMLLIPRDETGEQLFLFVGPPVPVGIFGIKDLRGRRDQHSISPNFDAVGERN